MAAKEMVKVNVYSPSGGQSVAYHSGLEVYGTEYVFAGGNAGGSGVTLQRPCVAPPGSGWVFYQSVEVAPLDKSKEEVQRAISDLRAEFTAASYDLVSRNCNHFSEALCQRLCGKSIPSWVNALAGIGNSLGVGNLIRNAMGQGAPAAAGGKADVGAGGLASAGLLAGSVGQDGDLSGEVDWTGVGVLNSPDDDASGALRTGSLVASEEDASAELLFLLPFKSQVKLQAVHLTAPTAAQAPCRVRLFANERNLDMNDAAGGVVPTADFEKVTWATGPGEAVTAKLEVNFLKFQNIGFLAMHVCREDEDGLPEEGGIPVCVQAVRFLGKM